MPWVVGAGKDAMAAAVVPSSHLAKPFLQAARVRRSVGSQLNGAALSAHLRC